MTGGSSIGHDGHLRTVEATGLSGDLVQLVNAATPYVVAAAGAYGGSVLAQAQEQAATATLGAGRRILQRVFGLRDVGEAVPEVLADVIDDPDDAESVGALRMQIHRALASDQDLAAQIRALVEEAQVMPVAVAAFGERSVANQTNMGIVATGDNNTFPQR